MARNTLVMFQRRGRGRGFRDRAQDNEPLDALLPRFEAQQCHAMHHASSFNQASNPA